MGYWFPKLGSGSTGEAPIDHVMGSDYSKLCTGEDGFWAHKQQINKEQA